MWKRQAVVRAGWFFLAGALVSMAIGLAASWGRSEGWPAAWFEGPESVFAARPLQPDISIDRVGERHGMCWRRSALFDLVWLRQLSDAEWKEWGWYTYRTPQDLELYFGYAGKLKTRPPLWASAPRAGKHEGVIETIGYGWPLRVMRCRGVLFAKDDDPALLARSWTDGFSKSQSQHVASPAWGIASKPIWWNLLLSAAVYGCVFWLLAGGLAAIRGVIRRGRGRCGGCGYDLRGIGGAVCPECGKLKAVGGQRLASSSSQRA
jgi:hypothetical protein